MKLHNYELMKFKTIWGLNFGFSVIVYAAMAGDTISVEGFLILLGLAAGTAWLMCKCYTAFKDTGDEE